MSDEIKMDRSIRDMLQHAIEREASDLHISPGLPPVLRIQGSLVYMDRPAMTDGDTEHFIRNVLTKSQLDILFTKGDVDASISCDNNNRLRLNAFKQKNTYSASLRLVKPEIPDFSILNLPEVILDLAQASNGLILVTGPTGTGKSTTLASMIDWINQNKDTHIITLEEPIEYVHRHKKSIVHQREIGTDVSTFSSGLRAALRQDPDVILIGEMRDLESISIALTAAETGHLVLSTLHTIGAAKTIDRIIDVFPPHQQPQIRVQLSVVIQAVISQQLVPGIDDINRVPAVEVMISNPAIRNLIRENKTHQIFNSIQTGSKQGMQTMDNSLLDLYRKKKISFENMLKYAVDPEYLRKQSFGKA